MPDQNTALTNKEIAQFFNQYATLLELSGDNPFRVRAYRNAARVITNLAKPISVMATEGSDLDELPSIGKDLAEKLTLIAKTGHFFELESLKRLFPAGVDELLDLPGIGPKRLKVLLNALHIRTRKDLAQAARHGMIRRLPGFGVGLESSLLKALSAQVPHSTRIRLADAEDIAEPLVAYLRASLGKDVNIDVAGSLRRRKDTVGDLDLLISGTSAKKAISLFTQYHEVSKIIAEGTTRASVEFKSGLQVDLRVVPEDSYGAALIYFTGSKAHNIRLRLIGKKIGLKINEYGVFRRRAKLAGRSEAEVYAKAGLCWIPPELREDRGEIELATNGKLPNLVSLKDIKGDLHCHTKLSDGAATLDQMAETAKKMGYSYLAITDHGKYLGITNGVDAKDLQKQIRFIDSYNSGSPGITILKGIEVDIRPDGTLSVDDTLLRELDVVVAAIHTSFNLTRQEQTNRLLKAIDNRYVNIIAHPTGRLIGQRAPYEVDFPELLKAARDQGCALEVNSQPSRLDLDDVACKMAKDMRVKLSISSDAHDLHSLIYMRYGVDQARRGWIESSDVLNTLGFNSLIRSLRR